MTTEGYMDVNITDEQEFHRENVVLTPQSWKRRWSHDIILRRLLERYRRGSPMRSKDVRLDDSALLLSTIRLFGSWTAGLEAAGLVRMPSGAVFSLMDYLRFRLANDLPMTIASVRKEGKAGRKMYRLALAEFGGWKPALAVAGEGKAGGQRPLASRGALESPGFCRECAGQA